MQPKMTSLWLRGKVKSVLSRCTLVIMQNKNLREKTVRLAHLTAPALSHKDSTNEPFAWDSREFLRKLCIGKDVVFITEYTILTMEYCNVFIGSTNVGKEVVSHGWAKVFEATSETTIEHEDLLKLEEEAKKQGVGVWNTGAAEASIMNLLPFSNLDAMGFLDLNKGKPMAAIVEFVRDGSSLGVLLLPDRSKKNDLQFVHVFVAGIRAPSMGRTTPEPALSIEVLPEPFGREAKHFTEISVLNRDVHIVFVGVGNLGSLVGSVHYSDGETAKDLAMELIKNGYAKYAEWSANMMEKEARSNLKFAELQAQKTKLRLWTNYVPPATNSKASDNFTGKVVEVVSGDCIIVANDALPFGSPAAERRVNLSSIRCPKLRNPGRGEDPDPYAREARELLRTRLIGRQVQVSMEYSRKPANSRVMEFGSVFFLSEGKGSEDVNSTTATPPTVNVAELIIDCGFGTVIKHRDFEEKSNHYENLLAAETRATSERKGIHSAKDYPSMHVKDLSACSFSEARNFLQSLNCNNMTAVVEYVISGHKFKLFLPEKRCSIVFSLSGVRCPGRYEPYSDDAISFMRHNIMQRDVEIKVETVDRSGAFIGSLWESNTNIGVILLKAGLAKIQTGFGADRIVVLAQAEESAKSQKLKIWENYVEGEEVTNGSTPEKKQKEEFKAVVTEVLDGCKFYVQDVADQKVSAIQQQLALKIKAPYTSAFKPKKGDIVLAHFTADNSWNRAKVVSGPRGTGQSFEVFYIDYGNQETVTYSQLRPADPSVSSALGLAQLCQLAYLEVPSLDEYYGQKAAKFLSERTLSVSEPKEFKAVIAEKDTSRNVLSVTLIDEKADTSINAIMLKAGLARLEKRSRWVPKDKQLVLDKLEKYEAEARTNRHGMWEYGDIQSYDEESPLPSAKKTARKR